MPNTLTFTAPINVPNLRTASIGTPEIDEDAKVMIIPVRLSGGGGAKHPTAFRLAIANGRCDGIAPNANPATIEDAAQPIMLTGAGLATAFDQCLAAYQSTKRNGLLNTMRALSGTVTGGPLAGQAHTVLPAGAVT